jgi:hypothetical protein
MAGQSENTDCTDVFAGHGSGLTSSADSSSTTGKLHCDTFDSSGRRLSGGRGLP